MGTEAKHLHSQPYRASIYSECERNDLLLETERERVSLRESSIFLENTVFLEPGPAWLAPWPPPQVPALGLGILGDPGQVILAQWPSPHWLLGVTGSSGVSEGDHPGEG